MELTNSSPKNGVNYREHLKKEAFERRRNILHLILQYLQDHNYKNTADSLLDETQFDLHYQVCENIDLEIILQEFQSYYHTKFQKYPKILRKLDEPVVLRPKPGRKNSSEKNKISPEIKKDEELFQFDIVSLGKNTEADTKTSFDFEGCTSEIKEMAEVIKQQIVPKDLGYTFDDCIGLNATIETLREAIIYPVRYPQLFTNVIGWKGILLYGPPGTGKTLLAKAVACESPATFINVSGSVFTCKWRGESEKMLKILFQTARNQTPATIFLDEVEALACEKQDHEASRRFKSELLTQIDGIFNNEEVFVLATTNSPWLIDEALLRRFEKRILVPIPDKTAREEIIRHYFSKENFNDDFYQKIVDATIGFTGSDLKNVKKEIDMVLIREKLGELKTKGNISRQTRKIKVEDFIAALNKIKPSVRSESYKKYIEWNKKYGAV